MENFKISNNKQEVPLEFYTNKFRQLDPQEVVGRTGVCFDDVQGRFVLEVLGFKISAYWPEFKLVPDDRALCPKVLYDFQMQVMVMRFLIESVVVPPSGSFLAYRELPWGELYDANFQGRCLKRLAYSFGYKLEDFINAAQKLGGVRLGLGDASFDLLFLGGVVCRLVLWAADDEFPPSAQFLFSDNAQLAFNAEDLSVVGDIVISSLKGAQDRRTVPLS